MYGNYQIGICRDRKARRMEKKKNIVSKIWSLLDKKKKWQTVLIMFFIIISAGAELIGVSIFMPIINMIMGQGKAEDSLYCRIIMNLFHIENDGNIIIILLLVTIAIYIIKNAYLAWMYGYIYRYAMNVRRSFAMKLMNAYMEQPYAFFVKRKTSDLIRSVNEDTGNVYEVIYSMCIVVSQGVTAGCIVAYLAMTNVAITIIVVLCLLICAGGIIKVLQKSTSRLGRANQYYAASLIKYLQQAFEGIKEIKVLNTEEHFSNLYDDVYKGYADNNRKFRVANMLPKYLIETVVIAGIMGYLAFNIQFNSNYVEIVPQLAVFIAAAYKLLPTVNSLYTYINSIHFYKASVDLIYRDIKEVETFKKAEKNNKKEGELPFEHEITMENVDFTYDGAEHEVLQNVSMSIQKGQSVALIGASGGGKTTTADLLLGLQTPTSGQIKVDGKNIAEYMDAWHKKIGYIPQSIFLIDDTIRNNVAFGIPEEEIDEEQVWKALDDACLKEFVEELPEKLDTPVGERGVCLSGGQRQRIGIARAIYRNPEVLFFDEATSALDNETEKEVMKAIEGLHGSKTMLIIAHRLSTIENCDVIYKVEEGKIEKQEGSIGNSN